MSNQPSATLQKITASRTVTELRAHVSPLITSVSSMQTELDAVLDLKQRPSSLKVRAKLNSASAEIESGTLVSKQPVRPARAAHPVLDDVTDLEGLKLDTAQSRARAARNLAILNQTITELNAAYQLLMSPNFSKMKTAKDTAASVAATIKEATVIRDRWFKLSQAAKDEVPAEHQSLAASVGRYLKSTIEKERYTKISLVHYIAGSSGSLVNYQSYITVADFTSDDGYTYPTYIMVITSSLNTLTGKTARFITSLVDSKAPGTFPFGSEFKSLPQLKASVNRLLAIDGTPAFGDRRPVGRSTDHMRKATALGLKTHNINGKDVQIIDGVRVSNHKIFVRLVKGMSPRERAAAINEVVAIVSSMYSGGMTSQRKNNAITYKVVRGQQGREWLEFSILPTRGSKAGSMTLQKINEVASLLGMDESQRRNLVAAMK